MDFSKLSAVLGRNKEQDPNFGQFVQEKAQEKWDEGGENLQQQEELKNRFIQALKEGSFDKDASRQLAEQQVGQMAMGSVAPVAMEASALRAGAPSSERIMVGAGKPVRISDGSKSMYGKNSPANLKLKQLMEEQAKARAAANAPLNAVDKTKIIIP